MKLNLEKCLYGFRLWLLVWMTVFVPVVQAKSIAIISDHESVPYQQVIKGFEESIKQLRPELVLIRYDSKKNKNLQQEPAVVFALGSIAVSETAVETGVQKLVATMILNTQPLEDVSHGVAVLLKVSARKQLEWHKRMLPKAKRVGVLYNPLYNQAWVDEAKRAADKLGLEIISVPVKAAKELPSALKTLGRNADSVLGIPDKTVYSGKTAKAVLLYSFRNRIPFVGLSKAWVKSGAFYALDWDYHALGKQCADIALKMIDKKKTNKIETQIPEKNIYLLNLKTAKHMKLNIDQKLIDGASRVYK